MKQKKNKVSSKQIQEAIKNRALSLKRKIEIYNEAKKLNDELKQLNEVKTMGQGFLAGPGFANRVDAQGNPRDSHEHIVGGKGAVTGRSATANDVAFKEKDGATQVNSNDGQGGRIFRFEELYGLEEEMANLGIDSGAAESEESTLDEIKAENAMLKEKIAKFEESVKQLSDGVSTPPVPEADETKKNRSSR